MRHTFKYVNERGYKFAFIWTDRYEVLREVEELADDPNSGFTHADEDFVSEHIKSIPVENKWRNRVLSYFFFGED